MRACDDHNKPKDDCHNCRIVRNLSAQRDEALTALRMCEQIMGLCPKPNTPSTYAVWAEARSNARRILAKRGGGI
jgi:hypothetical protein